MTLRRFLTPLSALLSKPKLTLPSLEILTRKRFSIIVMHTYCCPAASREVAAVTLMADASLDASQRRLAYRRRLTIIVPLTASSLVCGGMVAAIGPSIDSFVASTGMDEATLGMAIMHNRITKLIGLGLWTVYANALQRGGGFGLKPRSLMAACMLATALLSLAIAHIHSSFVLRVSLAIFGLCYGIVDSASLQLAMWSSNSLDTSRLSVATVSAGFTVGATVAPMVVATALKMGGSAHAGFEFLACVGFLGMALFLCSPPLPTGPTRQAALIQGAPPPHARTPSGPALVPRALPAQRARTARVDGLGVAACSRCIGPSGPREPRHGLPARTRHTRRLPDRLDTRGGRRRRRGPEEERATRAAER